MNQVIVRFFYCLAAINMVLTAALGVAGIGMLMLMASVAWEVYTGYRIGQ